MNILRTTVIALAGLGASAAFPGAAQAIGCNGVVNPAVAGCTRADNNDGPGFPYFHPQRVSIAQSAARMEVRQGTPMVQYQGKWLPVVSASGGQIIAVADGR